MGIQVDIPFDPPMLGYEEVRPRLLQMKIEAEEGIGMVSPPGCSGSAGLQSDFLSLSAPLSLCIAFRLPAIH